MDIAAPYEWGGWGDMMGGLPYLRVSDPEDTPPVWYIEYDIALSCRVADGLSRIDRVYMIGELE